jgi:hypothetical protein
MGNIFKLSRAFFTENKIQMLRKKLKALVEDQPPDSKNKAFEVISDNEAVSLRGGGDCPKLTTCYTYSGDCTPLQHCGTYS